MKKNITKILLPGFTLIICLFFLIQGYPSLSFESFSRFRSFSYPDVISLDNSGNTFIVENGWKQITKLNPAGEILFSLEGGKRSSGFYEVWQVATDSTGYFYLLNNIRDIESGYVLSEQIIRYTPQGVKDRIIEDFSYSKKTIENNPSFSFGRIISMKVIGDTLCFLYRGDKEPELRRINIASFQTLPSVSIKNMDLIIDFTIHNGNIYITQKDGKILKYSMKGNLLPFTIAEKNINSPCMIFTNFKNDLIYSDIGLRKVIHCTDSSSGIVFDINSYKKSKIKSDDFLARNLAVSENGEIAFLDGTNNHIILLNPDYSIKTIFENAKFKPVSTFIIILYLIAFIACLLIAAYFSMLVFRFFFNAKFRLITKFISITVTLYFIISLCSGIFIFREMSAYQETDSQKNLEQLSYVMASSINADALKRITLPAHYMNSDYNILKNQLCGLLSTDKSGMYALLYKEYDGKLYYTVDMTGFYGTRFPYTKAQSVHFNALKGQSGYTTYKDNEGDWMIGVSPVKDSSNKVIGILEVGKNHFVEEEIKSVFIYKIIIIVGIIIIISAAFTLFSFYFLFSPLRKISSFVAALGKSEKETEIAVSSNDEFKTLASDINSLTGRIFTHLNEVREKTNQNENSDSVKTMFIANTVHDLKTPVNGISGITESIIEQSGDTVSKKVKSELNLILLSAKRLSSMINDIINYSDSQLNIKLDIARVRITDVISHVRSVYLFSSADKEMLIEYKPHDVPEINADRIKLEKVLFSIIGYVLSMSHENKCEISLTQNSFAVIEISGFICRKPEPVFQQLFENNSIDQNMMIQNSSEYYYGLSVAKAIIQMHKGSIAMQFEKDSLIMTIKIPAGV